MKRRKFLTAAALFPTGLALAGSFKNFENNLLIQERLEKTMAKFELAPLPYAYNALEPYIDAATMEIHHSKHHQAYVNNLNAALEANKVETNSLESLFSEISNYPAALRNNGGGVYNHNLFWSVMKPNGGGNPEGQLLAAINSAFTNIDELKSQFNNAAMTRFGSGWAWLVVADNKLKVTSSPNQDNPLMDIADVKGTPILTLDVWEHAYYLKYQNKRNEYVANWWNTVNWEEVAKLFANALK